MKKKISAVTLVELIIASLIVSMVVAGVFSAEYALRRTSETGSEDTRTGIQTKALAAIVRSSIRAVHGYIGNTGISTNLGTKTMCFRHDIAVLPGPQYSPDNYNDDSWTCYTQIVTNVYRCERTPNAGVCTNADTLVGALASDQFTNGIITALGPTITTNVATGELSFKMTLVGRKDPTGATANLGKGTDTNPQSVVNIFESAGM
jgi:hypothetical protein